jgi:hypothetical protein
MKIQIILPYPGLPTAEGTIFDAQDEETPEDVTADDNGEDTGEDTGDTGDDQFQTPWY